MACFMRLHFILDVRFLGWVMLPEEVEGKSRFTEAAASSWFSNQVPEHLLDEK